MGDGENLLVSRVTTNTEGNEVSIDKLTVEELQAKIKDCIRQAIREEWALKGGPDYYKRSWLSHLGNSRAYYDMCQVLFHVKKVKIEEMIKETEESEYAKQARKSKEHRGSLKSSNSLSASLLSSSATLSL